MLDFVSDAHWLIGHAYLEGALLRSYSLRFDLLVANASYTLQVPITYPYLLHYIICHLPLVSLSPTSPLPFYLPSLFLARFSSAMSESKRVRGSFPSFSTLDNPSILAELINKDAMERPTGVINENLNNFDEDDSGIFRYLLDESLKDARDRLLRIRASYVPQ